MKKLFFISLAIIVSMLLPFSAASADTDDAKLLASDGTAGDTFGVSVATSGDIVVVGASAADIGSNQDAGAVYVFEQSGDNWTEQAKLLPSDSASSQRFGVSLAISGNTLAIGAYTDSQKASMGGAVYIFERSGDSWVEKQKLMASDGTAAQLFGYSVGISGNRMVVGAAGDSTMGSFAGAAYVFELSGDSWAEKQKLTASDGAASDWFGCSAGISGDTVVIGALNDDSYAGSAYVFERGSDNWTEKQKLTASDAAKNYFFGDSTAISEDTIVIGSKGNATIDGNAGAAYVFARESDSWAEKQKLLASDGAESDSFGYSVAISESALVIGAVGDSDNGKNSGSAYIFELDTEGKEWAQLAKLLAGDGATDDYFGWSVGTEENTVVAGALYNDENGVDAGAAYVYPVKLNRVLDITINGQGSVSRDPNLGVYPDGTVVTLTAEANTGWAFESWGGELSGTKNPETITMDADKSVTANFAIITYIITATAGNNGAIIPEGEVEVGYGSNQAFAISADEGYSIDDVAVDDESVGAVSEYTFENVTANHTIEASFVSSAFTITATAGTGGSISPDGEVEVGYGNNQTFTISAGEGYSVDDVVVDGGSVGAVSEYTFENVTANHTIEASFATSTYIITATAGEGGTIDPEGEVAVGHGGSQTFAISAGEGYSVDDVVADGGSVGAVSEYTFENVTANHTVVASFATNTYTITATAGEGGTIDPEGEVAVGHGGSQTFAISADDGYSIDDVAVDDESVGAVSEYVFTNVVTNHTIVASFAVESAPGAYTIKSGTIEKLEGAKAGDKITDRSIDRIIKLIESSLNEALWAGESQLDARLGRKVFSREAAAATGLQIQVRVSEKRINALEKIIAWKEKKGRDTSREQAKLAAINTALPVFEEALNDLAEADRLLAQEAVSQAESTPVQNPRFQRMVELQINRANKELSEAEQKLQQGREATAIIYYGKAWSHAQQAIKYANRA